MKRFLALLGLSLLLASCATLQRRRDESGMLRVAQLINSGAGAELAAMSSVPFLLDQEILLLAKDVASFWTGIIQAGYTVEEPELERGGALQPDSYREFRDSMEVKAFFHKYVKKGTRLLELRTRDGRRILLLTRSAPFSWRIIGFKGPY